ncbi:hypothetical protein FRC01_001227, partial [Tulasnella sp. 417]
SRYREAEEALNKAHEIHSRIGNDLGTANALQGLGSIYRAQSRYREAEDALKKAHGIHSRIGNDLGTANALDGLGSIYRGQSRYREAEEALKKAHEIHSRIGSDLGTANALDGLGSIYRAQSRYREAGEALNKAHEIHSRIGNHMGTANALLGLGELHRTQSRSQEAEQCLTKAQHIYSLIGDDLGTGNTFRMLGLLLSERGQHDKAQSLFCQALSAYDREGSSFDRAQTLLLLAQTHLIKRNSLEAEESLNEALIIGIQLGDDRLQAPCLALLSQIFSSGLKYSVALAATLHARVGCRQTGDDDILRGAVLHDHAKAFLVQSKYGQAKDAYSLSRALFFRAGDARGEASALRSLGTLSTLQGQFELAANRFAQARSTSIAISDYDGELMALGCLMGACLLQSNIAGLKSYCREALKIYDRTQWSGSKVPSARPRKRFHDHLDASDRPLKKSRPSEYSYDKIS